MHDACWTAAAGLSLVDPLRGSYYVSETLLRSLRLGVVETLPRDLAAFIGQSAIGGSRSRRTTCRILIASRRLGTRKREDPYIKAMPIMSRGIAALLRGEWVSCLKCCDRAVQYLTAPGCFGKTWELSTARTFALWSLQYQGNLLELSKRQPELLNAAIAADDLFATLNYGTQVMTHLQLAADQPEEAERWLAEDKKRLSDRGFFVQHHNYVLASTYTYLYTQQYDRALAAVEGQWLNYHKSFLSQIQQVRIDHHQVFARALLAAAADGIDRARNLKRARSMVRKLRAEKVAWATALAMSFDAAVEKLEGRTKQCAVKLEAAEKLLDRVSMKLFAAAVQTWRTELAGSAKDPAEEIWQGCGVTNGQRMARVLLPGI